MNKKDIKKVISLSAPVVALGIGAAFGLSEIGVTALQEGLIALGSAVLTILGVFGVVSNNDKDAK